MTKIRFIVKGSSDTVADQAYELKQYLETNWDAQIETHLADTQTTDAAPTPHQLY